MEVPVTLDNYAEFVTSLEPPVALTTEVFQTVPAKQIQTSVRLLHAGLGMVTEVGEFVDAIKKALFAGRYIDRVNLIEELGDIRWYYQLAMNALHTTDAEVVQVNANKLKLRHGKTFNVVAAGDYGSRDLASERQNLEASLSTIKEGEV